MLHGCVDLGLPETTIDTSFIPDPIHIKKANKREKIPLTLRIDDEIYSAIALFSKQNHMSINSFVNELLTSYTKAHGGNWTNGYTIRETTIIGFLDRLKIKYLDDDMLKKMIKKIKNMAKAEARSFRLQPWTLAAHCWFFDMYVHLSNDSSTNYTLELGDFFDELDEARRGKYYSMSVPEKKFWTAAAILLECESKKEVYMWDEKFSENSANRLCTIIDNSKTTKTLVRNLTEALKPDGTRFSIWYKEPKEEPTNE